MRDRRTDSCFGLEWVGLTLYVLVEKNRKMLRHHHHFFILPFELWVRFAIVMHPVVAVVAQSQLRVEDGGSGETLRVSMWWMLQIEG